MSNLNHVYFFVDGLAQLSTVDCQDGLNASAPTSRSHSPSAGSSDDSDSSASSGLNPAAQNFVPGVPPQPIATQLFELRKLDGKGLGLVATSFIPIVTRIICEAPLLRIDGTSVALAWDPYCRLSNAKKKAYDALEFFSPEYMQLENVSRGSLIDPNGRSLQNVDFKEIVQEHVRVMGTFACNNFQCGQGLGVFETTSRLNNSCTPNVHHSYNPNLNKQTVHAVRDIEPGEELCTTYIGGYGSYLVRSQRVETLHRNYGFTCTCSACSDCSGESDFRRQAMATIAYGLQAFAYGGEQAHYVPKSVHEAFWQAENLIALLIDEGLFTIELCKAYRTASKYALQVQAFEKAMEYALNEQEVERNCLGQEIDDLHGKGAAAACWIRVVRDAASAANVRLSEKYRGKAKRQKTHAQKQRQRQKKADRKARRPAEEAEQKKAELAARKQVKELETKRKQYEAAWPALKG